MKEFFRKIGLVEQIKIELPVQRAEFISELKVHVDEPRTELFEVFSNSRNDYKGKVEGDTFDIKKRRRLFDSRLSFARAIGRITAREDGIVIEVELIGYSVLIIPFFVFLFAIYGFAIISVLFRGVEFLWTIPLIVIHAAFMIGIPYVVMRKSITRIHHNIERDFFFMIRHQLSPTGAPRR
jgi:hypothetical protein